MAITVKKFIGSNGDVLLPLSQNESNSANLISDSGVYYLAITEEIVAIEAGNPMGPWLWLTYPATP